MPNHEELRLQAESLTSQAESGASVSAELNAMPFQDRLQVAKIMDAINARHSAQNANLPDLELTTSSDGVQDHLTDIKATKSGWFGTKDSKDVYDPPAAVTGGPSAGSIIGNTCDTLDSKVKDVPKDQPGSFFDMTDIYTQVRPSDQTSR